MTCKVNFVQPVLPGSRQNPHILANIPSREHRERLHISGWLLGYADPSSTGGEALTDSSSNGANFTL